MRLITIDFETYYDKQYSLKKLTTEAYIRHKSFEVIGFAYKIGSGSAPVWVSGDKAHLQTVLDSLDISNAYLLCHNTVFDGAILAWHFGIKPKYYLDTLSMSRPVHGLTVGGSLEKLSEFYNIGKKGTEVKAVEGKHRTDFSSSELDQYGSYCVNDVELTHRLYEKLLQHSSPQEMYLIDLMIRMFTDPVLELDQTVLSEHLGLVRERKSKLMEKIDESIGTDALMSNPKFAEVLKKLGVEPPTKVSLRTGKETFAFGKTDVAFKELLNHPNELVQSVVAARLGVKSTLEETRTESFLEIADRGRLPIMLNYYGAHTGRASGGDKINLQNLPRGGALRHAIRAPKGHALIAIDSSQIEARIVAWLAGQHDLIADFAAGEDIYSKFASDIYGKPVTKADKVERFVGKTCILGLGYGMGAEKFRHTLKIGQGGVSVDLPEKQCEDIVNLYRSKYEQITNLWKAGQHALVAVERGLEASLGVGVALKCDKEGIHLPNGMLVRYPGLRKVAGQFEYQTKYGFTKVYGGKVIENVVQSLARIVVFNQMGEIDLILRKHDSEQARHKVVLTVHDEVVACVPDVAKEEYFALMTQIMGKTPNWCKDLPLSCEGECAKSYGECK
jgi:DNA polymerase